MPLTWVWPRQPAGRRGLAASTSVDTYIRTPYGLAFRLVLWFIGRAGHVDHKITGEGAYRSLIVQAKCYLWSSAERDPALEV